ncbi:MAG TPA: hypothetical protein VIN11_03065 [Roseivirga sp.]
MKQFIICLLAFSVFACNSKPQVSNTEEAVETVQYNAHHIPEIIQVFEAHGGYANWAKLKTLSFENGGSKTLVELQNRYTRIESENQTIGFDGEQVWVYPASDDADRQRMRYNLMFYFYAFPFVVGDPGVNYEAIDQIRIKGELFNAVKVTYNAGIGDAPNDSYIILSNPSTHQMQWLLYTATFGGEASDRYSLIKYEGWQEIGGVIIPTSLQWYTYNNGEAGDPRGAARVFQNIQVSKEFPAMENFRMPEGAAVAKLPAEQ